MEKKVKKKPLTQKQKQSIIVNIHTSGANANESSSNKKAKGKKGRKPKVPRGKKNNHPITPSGGYGGNPPNPPSGGPGGNPPRPPHMDASIFQPVYRQTPIYQNPTPQQFSQPVQPSPLNQAVSETQRQAQASISNGIERPQPKKEPEKVKEEQSFFQTQPKSNQAEELISVYPKPKKNKKATVHFPNESIPIIKKEEQQTQSQQTVFNTTRENSPLETPAVENTVVRILSNGNQEFEQVIQRERERNVRIRSNIELPQRPVNIFSPPQTLGGGINSLTREELRQRRNNAIFGPEPPLKNILQITSKEEPNVFRDEEKQAESYISPAQKKHDAEKEKYKRELTTIKKKGYQYLVDEGKEKKVST